MEDAGGKKRRAAGADEEHEQLQTSRGDIGGAACKKVRHSSLVNYTRSGVGTSGMLNFTAARVHSLFCTATHPDLDQH